MQPKEQLNLLGIDLFCKLVKKGKINLRDADLRNANLRDADLQYADIRNANLWYANLRNADLRDADLRDANLQYADLWGANLDFSVLSLWCGSSNMKIDERLAKQLLAHTFNAAKEFWPDELTKKQKDWLNEFHRIQSNEFPRFE